MAALDLNDEVLTDHARKNLSILETIKRNKTISRTDISKLTKLNIVTVSNYVNNYIEQGLVVEKGLDISSGGRRPTIVELNPKFGYVIGVDLGLRKIICTLTDLEANILAKSAKPRPIKGEEEVMQVLLDCIGEVIDKSKIDTFKIKGICVGASGVIDKEAGTIHSTAGTVSIYVPVTSVIEQKYNIPTYLENDATSAAYGEWSMGLGHTIDIKVLLYMHSGVGCGLIIDGEIYHGASGTAGEPSIKEPETDHTPCWVGQRCPMAPWTSDIWVTDEAKAAIEGGQKSKIKDMVKGNLEKIDMYTVINASKEEDALAKKLMQGAGRNLGIKIAFLINLFNPSMVVIGGGIEQGGALFLDSVKEMVKKYAFEEMANVVKIVPARLGEDSACLGAASLVIRRVFTHM
jgi:predicted NBD/HSP70 family sugar kinase